MDELIKKAKKLLHQTPRRHLLAVAGIGAVLVIFAIAKSRDHHSSTIRTIYQGDFKKNRILSSTADVITDGKAQLLNKTALEISEQQKELLSSVKRLEDRLTGLEKKEDKPEITKEREAEAAEPAPKPNQMSPEESKAKTIQDDESQRIRPVPRSDVSSVVIPNSAPRTPLRGPSFISFPVKSRGEVKEVGVTLPAGSYVKSKLMTGIEAPEGKPYPVLLQLDYAYILPNKHRVDLSGCFLIAKAQGDLSTERVQMQATKLSCVSRRGEMFESEVTGFVADDADNSFAVTGTVNSKQDKVAAMSFLSSVVKGVGDAIQRRQTTIRKDAEGGSETSVTGDEKRYAIAGGASEAAGKVADWYLKQAENLLPTINVGSGRDLWVVMQEKVELPESYFEKIHRTGEEDEESYVARILD